MCRGIHLLRGGGVAAGRPAWMARAELSGRVSHASSGMSCRHALLIDEDATALRNDGNLPPISRLQRSQQADHAGAARWGSQTVALLRWTRFVGVSGSREEIIPDRRPQRHTVFSYHVPVAKSGVPGILGFIVCALIRRRLLTNSVVCLFLLLTLFACQNPRYINGRKVVGARWVNGHVVYLLEPSEEDRAATQKALKDSDEAARTVTFEPTGK